MSEQMELWPARPHTVAKIAMLKAYLTAWSAIFAQSRFANGQDLVYVDGFAGPGEYSNGFEGSPVVALKTFTALRDRLRSTNQWRSGKLRCLFIEEDRLTSIHLENLLTRISMNDPDIHWQVERGSFASVFPRLRQERPSLYSGESPTLLFLDPFGPTGVPFKLIKSVLARPRCELLLNFDHDGHARIFQAGSSANADELLTSAFGTTSWRSAFAGKSSRSLYSAALDLYKQQLRSIEGVDFVSSFQMQTPTKTISGVGYSLVFASRHEKGLEKMKEAMTAIDQTGGFEFSNAYRGQLMLFRFNDPAYHAESLFEAFAGKQATMAELNRFALIETPFLNAKSMLKHLDMNNRIAVVSMDPKRRKGTFAESAIVTVAFNARRLI